MNGAPPRASRRPIQREKYEQSLVVSLLRSVGARVYTIGTRRRRGDYQGTMMAPGIPDLVAFLPPPLLGGVKHWTQLWVEVKAGGGRLSQDQEAFRQHCLASHVEHVVGGVDATIAFLVRGGWLKSQNVPHYRRPSEVGRDETFALSSGRPHGTPRGPGPPGRPLSPPGS